jgi:hypothetical protein
MYTAKDASVAFSLMAYRFQPSNTSLLLNEYFLVCKLYGDTATARETHQRYVTQIENMRGIFTSQTLRNSEQEAFRDVNAGRFKAGDGFHSTTTVTKDPQSPPVRRRGSPSAAETSPQSSSPSLVPTVGANDRSGDSGHEHLPRHGVIETQEGAAANAGNDERSTSKSLSEAHSPRHSLSPTLSQEGKRGSPSPPLEGQRDVGDFQRRQASLQSHTTSHHAGAGVAADTSSGEIDGNTRNAASFTILRREWGPESYEEQFHKPWNAFLRELSAEMMEVVTAWVSDLDECTPYSQHLIRRSSTCCYDAAHGMCLLRWNTMREVRAYVDALHAVVNAPLSSFFVPLTLGMQVLGVPVLCMSLAPVTGPWQGWDTVTVVWHSFCGLCANLRLMRPLDRAEGGRSETADVPLLNGFSGGGGGFSTSDGTAAARASSPHAASGAGGVGNSLERSVAWSLLRQLEPAASGNEYYSSGGVGAAPMSSYDAGPHTYANGGMAPAAATSRDSQRNSVFRGDPTTLTSSATGIADRISRQVFASAAAGQGGPFSRSGGLQLTPAIGADARWYFIDARAICLYQWYARSSWVAARVPRREMFQSENGCVQRSVGPNKLILQSKLRIMVGQLLNGLLRFNSNNNGSSLGVFASPEMHSSGALQSGFRSTSGAAAQRHWVRGRPPVLLSTLCHSHGVRYGTYVYAIFDLLRTEEASLDEAVQTAYRHGSSSPNNYELLKQCRRCIQALVGELIARVVKHLIYQEWHVVIRQNPDWLHRFHSLCVAVTEAQEMAAASAAAAAATAEESSEATSVSTRKSRTQNTAPRLAGDSSTVGPAVEATREDTGSGSRKVNDKSSPVLPAAAEGEWARIPLQGEDESAMFELVADEKAAEETQREATTATTKGKRNKEATVNEEEDREDELGSVSAAARHRRLLAFIDETREVLGAPLLEAVRRVLNGVFTVNMLNNNTFNNSSSGCVAPTSPGNNTSAENGATGPLDTPSALSGSSVAGNSVEQRDSPLVPFLSTASGAGVSIMDSANRFVTDEAGRSLATSSVQALGGYPVFNQQLSAVAFRPNMFEELLHSVNECYAVRPYNGNEKMNEWQLLHKRAPVVTRRGQYARTPLPSGSSSSGGGGGGGGLGGGSGSGGSGALGNGSGGGGGGSGGTGGATNGSNVANNSSISGGGDTWLGRGGSRSGLGGTAASAPVSPAPKRGRSLSRLRGAIPVYYPAADEESIQVDAKELFPGWSLQCLEELLGIPLVLRQSRVDIDSSFTGADILRSLAPSFLSAQSEDAAAADEAESVNGGRFRAAGDVLAARPPLSSGCPLRSAVWGTTLELPLCLRSGSVEGALEYAQHQREIGIAIVSSGLSTPFLGQGRSGAALSTVWRGHDPHMVYMGKLIQLHSADVRIACRGWPIVEDFDFLKQPDQPNNRFLGVAGAGRTAWPRRRCLDAPFAHRQYLSRTRGGGGTAVASSSNLYNNAGDYGNAAGNGELTCCGMNSEDTLTALSFSSSMHLRLSLLNARVDPHEAMSSMWHLTECIENMNGSHVVYGYLLRQKIKIIAIIAAQFTASGVTTALEAAIADLDDLTGGIFNFSPVNDSAGQDAVQTSSRHPTTRAGAGDGVVVVNGFGRRVDRSPSRPLIRAALAGNNSSVSNSGAADRCTRATAIPPSPRRGGTADTASQLAGTPPGSQTSTHEYAPRAKRGTPTATATSTDNGGAGGESVAAAASTTPALPVDRLHNVPLPPPINLRQVAVVAAVTHNARASLDVQNPLSVGIPLPDSGTSAAGLHMTPVTRTVSVNGGAAPSTQLVGSIGAFKSFTLRSVQCVDLYTTLLELLTRHMLLPGAHRTPKESLSRAVMFCSLRRELIVMTHGENSVEAAMAARDVGLLLLQNPKTWQQAKTEFYRARRSIVYHLRELARDGGGGSRTGGDADRQLAASAMNLYSSVLGGQFSSSVLAHDNRSAIPTCGASRLLNTRVPPKKLVQAPLRDPNGRYYKVSSDDALNSLVALTSRGGADRVRSTWTFMNRESWATTPDRLKQALCSVLNNIAYLFCRQAQRQHVLNQQSMSAYVRAARQQNVLQKPSTGIQLHERRQRRAAKVEHFLREASATLQGVLHHASDIPVYDYAVALNNQACVLLHRYKYASAKRLLLQSLRVTMQLQSLSVTPVVLPVWLVRPQGSSEIGSVLWLLDGAQLPAAARGGDDAGGKSDIKAKEEPSKTTPTWAAPTTAIATTKNATFADAVAAPLTSSSAGVESSSIARVDAPAKMEGGGAVGELLLNLSSRPAPGAVEGEGVRPRASARAVRYAPNPLSTIASMLKDLGAPLDKEDYEINTCYYATGFPSEYSTRSATACRASPSSPSLAIAAAETSAPSVAAAAVSMLPSPITVSSAEQLRSCQVHTLRMLYQLEVQKSFIDRLRVQQLFSRYLTRWRERRQQRRAHAAKELCRFGVAAMTRVYLARRYRFSGYHWWLRQPREIHRHLDPLFNQQALGTRRQLWDVWNVQVEKSARLLQRVLRGSAVRKDMGTQYQFRHFYFLRCRPAVEEAVWQKMNLLYTSALMHLHVQEGLSGMSAFKEAVQSGAMWMARVTEPLRTQQDVARIRIQLKELQRREALERDFYKTLTRQRLSQLQVAQMKESVLLVIRSPRPSSSAAVNSQPRAGGAGAGAVAAVSPTLPQQPAYVAQQEQQQQQQLRPLQRTEAPTETASTSQVLPYVPPLALATAVKDMQQMKGGGRLEHSPTLAFAEADTAPPNGGQTQTAKHTDITHAHAGSSTTSDKPPAAAALPPAMETVPGTSIQLMKSPLFAPRDHRGGDALMAAWNYTPPAAFGIKPAGAFPPANSTRNSNSTPSRPFAPSSSSVQLSPPSPTTSTTSFSRPRRARQVVIQADAADLDADVVLSPRSTAASEEHYRQMQRQYREDERVKMTQLLRRRTSGADGKDGKAEEETDDKGSAGEDAGLNNDSSATAPRKWESDEKLLHHEGGYTLITPSSEDANTKWRAALQRAAEPRTSSVQSESSSDRWNQMHGSMLNTWAGVGGNSRDADRWMQTPSQWSVSPASPGCPAAPEHPPPPPPQAVPPQLSTSFSLLSQERKTMTLPCPDSVVMELPTPRSSAPSSPPLSSAATSLTASSRVAVVVAEVQRNQLQRASELLLQFWWQKRALPTYAESALSMHRLYNEHCCTVHEIWRRDAGLQLSVRQLVNTEEEMRFQLWQSEVMGRAGLLLLQVYSMRCCREINAHAKLLTTTLTTEERRSRAALLLAATARGHRPQTPQ